MKVVKNAYIKKKHPKGQSYEGLNLVTVALLLRSKLTCKL